MTPEPAQQLADVHRVLLTEDHFNDLMAAAARIDKAAGRIDDIEAKIDQLLTLHPPAPPTSDGEGPPCQATLRSSRCDPPYTDTWWRRR